MEDNGWAKVVRQQVDMGRLLPLGGPEDGAWITERAAARALRRAACEVPGIHLDRLRIALVDPDTAPGPAVPAPVSALPPGPLRIKAAFSTWTRRPLPEIADQLRHVLLAAAEVQLGLDTAEVDLHVTDLLEGPEPTKERRENRPNDVEARVPSPTEVKESTARLVNAVAAVPGVAHLAAALGGSAHPIAVKDGDDPPGRHIQVQLAVAAGHRALDVARAVRATVTTAAAGDAPGPVTVAALVTAVEPAGWLQPGQS